MREDEWGGDATRRTRFLVDVFRAVRAAVGPHFPVGVKVPRALHERLPFPPFSSPALDNRTITRTPPLRRCTVPIET